MYEYQSAVGPMPDFVRAAIANEMLLRSITLCRPDQAVIQATGIIGGSDREPITLKSKV